MQGLQQWWAVGGHWDPRKQVGLLHSSLFLMINCKERFTAELFHTELFFSIVTPAAVTGMEWALRLGDVFSSIRGDVQELCWKILYTKQEAEATSGNICAVISQHWHSVKVCQVSQKDIGLAMQHGYLILDTSHQLCPLRRGTRTALVGHVLCKGLLPSACPTAHRCYCWHILPGCRVAENSRVLHAWPDCPGNKFNWPWVVFSK